MRLIDWLHKFNDSLEIEYNEYSFQGLKLRKYEEYPWNNVKEKEIYFKNLLQDKSETSMLLYIHMLNKESLESIHVNLSRKFVARYLAVLFLGISLTMMIIGFALGTYVNSALCLLLLVCNFYFTRKANEHYKDVLLTPILIEMVFTMN
ncbi:MAG: hypothetical protein ABSG89_09030 [Bacteroidales bacterium]|jgi:hypothetical protein